MPVNVLAMDGGGSLSLVSLFMLDLIEKRCPGFLAKTQVFAGTSAGGINGLLMATAEDRRRGLSQAIQLWTNNPFYTSLPRVVSAALGCRSVYSNQGFVNVLNPIFGTRTLGDLAESGSYVVIPSFDLMRVGKEGERTWTPRVFHNLGGPGRSDSALPVLDAALRTSAAPVFLPIHQGFVDGGTFANNPSMCALSRVLSLPLTGEGGGAGLGEIRMLSLGTGRDDSFLDVQDASWGWSQWLFDPRRPLALIELFFEAGMMEASNQCATILQDNFRRLNPVLRRHGKMLDFDLEDQALPREDPRFPLLTAQLHDAVHERTADWLDSTVQWLERVGWCGEPAREDTAPAAEPPAATKAPGPPRRGGTKRGPKG
jgi:hypothetical protein